MGGVSALHVVLDTVVSWKLRQIDTYVVGLSDACRKQCDRAGIVGIVGDDHVLGTVADALAAYHVGGRGVRAGSAAYGLSVA